MAIPLNQRYKGRIESCILAKANRTPIKVYFASILGRDPKKYEWKESKLSQHSLLTGLDSHLEKSDHCGVPHIAVSFPHVTAVYRWGDPRNSELETSLYKIGSGDTPKLKDINISLRSLAVGCPAEIMALNQEMLYWTIADDISSYAFNPHGNETPDISIADPNKLRTKLLDRGKLIEIDGRPISIIHDPKKTAGNLVELPFSELYQGEIEGHAFIESILAKIYFANNGRTPKWKEGKIPKAELLKGLEDYIKSSENEGIPHFIVAFPDTTHVYRWGDPRNSEERETNIHKVGSCKTSQLDQISISQPHIPFEIGGPVETKVIQQELVHWAEAQTIDDYIKKFISNRQETSVAEPDKLRANLTVQELI